MEREIFYIWSEYAKKHYFGPMIDDIIMEGWKGYQKAVETFNPNNKQGASFKTWALIKMKGKASDYIKYEKIRQYKNYDESEVLEYA